MRRAVSLPDLEVELDRLEPGGIFYITRKDYTRHFGTNDAAHGRLKNFASLHHCSTNWDVAGLRFCKKSPTLPG